ncbi:putative metallocarboxypeptidase ecm14 [Lecanora helva]
MATPPPTLLAQYGGDLVLRFEISSHEEAEALASAVNVLFLDVWEFTADWVDIRLSKDVVPSLLGLLPPSLQHAHTPLMHDLAQAIFESYPSLTLVDPSPPAQGPSRPFSHDLRPSTDETNIFFREYQPLSVIVPWMRLLRSLFPTHVRMLNIGYSYEGRDIPALRVGVHPTNSEKPSSPRKTIIITGGSHAREWISTSSVNYAAYSFITAYGKSKSMTKLLEEFDFIFVPTLNPDGYVYTWENDRLWRKNRQQTPLRFCKGLDLDRTYGFEWDSDSTKSNPCSESFSGEAPFEGVESRRFANWVHNETENNNVKVIGFLDLHSYSQQVLYPYSFSCTSAPPTLENLEEGAIGLAKAIRLTHGEIYGVTSACEGSVQVSPSAKCCQQRQQKSKTERALWPTIESGGGSALDWFYHELRVPYAYQIKLRDTGSYGFLLPAKNIVPTGKETFAAIEHFGQFLMGNKGIEVEEEEQLTEKISVQESNRNDMKPTTEDDWVVVDEPEEESMVGDKGLTGWELRRRKR